MLTNYGQLSSGDRVKTLTSLANTVGRHPDNSFVIDHPSISKFHAIIEFDDGSRAYLSDKGSLNGTKLNGISLQSQKQYPLQSGDKIRFGFDEHEYRFLNFGLLDTKNKELDRTHAEEVIGQFIEENRLHEIKGFPKPTEAMVRQGMASGQSEIEISMIALIDKLETEIGLIAQKIQIQETELLKANSELQGTEQAKKSLEQDKELVTLYYC